MAASTRRSSGPVLRSLSPSGRLYGNHLHGCHSAPPPPGYSSSSAFASSTSTFSVRSSRFFHRSAAAAPIPVPTPSVRFSFDRSVSPGRSISVSRGAAGQVVKKQPAPKKTCMCSPTSHPGSFRCSLHKGCGPHSAATATLYSPSRLDARRSAMKNSIVRIGGVEGDLVKRALAALIRPSSHQQRRRAAFQPRPSRLSVMSRAEGLD